MHDEKPDLKEHLKTLHRDGVLWKAERLWSAATDPDTQATAIEQIAAMLMAMKNEAKRTGYTTAIADELSAKARDHQRRIATLEKEIDDNEKRCKKLQLKKTQTTGEQAQLQEILTTTEDLRVQVKELKVQPLAELPEALLKKSVRDATKKRKSEMEAQKMQAKFEQQVKSAADVGLPEDFKGDLQSVFDAIKYGIYVHEEVYYSRGGGKGDFPISNFTMKIFYHVKTGDENAYRLIAVKNVYGIEQTINMNTDDFVSLGSFKKVLARHGDFVFKGAESDLSRLQEYLQRDEISTKNIGVLGWQQQGGFWAWGNGISPIGADEPDFLPADMHGMIDYKGRKYLISACADMYEDKDDEFVNEKKFIYTPPQEGFGFTEWCTLMQKVYKKRALPCILYYIAAIYRDVVYKHTKKFPLLNLFGPPGGGKSEMRDSLLKLLTIEPSAISLEGESTGKSYMRKLAQQKNGIAAVEEFKNNQIKHIGNLKNAYDGIGYDRAKMTNDNQTKQTPVTSSIVLVGQEMPTAEPALFTRVIMVSFEEGKFSQADQDNFQMLKKTHEYHGLSYLTAGLLKHRQIIATDFSARLPVLFKEIIKEVNNPEMMDRMILNISILLCMYDLLKEQVKFPFGYNEVKNVLMESCKHQHAILQGADNAARFWEIVQGLFHNGLIHEGKDFELEDGYLFIYLVSVHPLYIKEMIALRDENKLAKSTLEYYLQLDKTKFVKATRRRFANGGNINCYQFRYAPLKIDLIGIAVKDSYGMSPAQKAEKMAAKYIEMGITDDVPDFKHPVKPEHKAPVANSSDTEADYIKNTDVLFPDHNDE